MNYGVKIKNARKTLKATQAEVASKNLSRNLLSNIEMGKTNLIPQKAIAIYERIIELSCFNEIYVDFELDDILKKDRRYQAIKEAHHLCFRLHNAVIDQVIIDENNLLEAERHVKKVDIGIIKFYFYVYLARYYDENKQSGMACDSYFNALDYLKWQEPKETLVLLERTLTECTYTAFQLEKYSELAEYNALLVERKEDYEIPFSPTLYYNLAIYQKLISKPEDALKSINLYISKAKTIDTAKYVNALIIKADIYSNLKMYEKSSTIYEECITLTSDKELKHQYGMCLSNMIFTIAKHQVKIIKDEFSNFLDQLNEFLQTADEYEFKRAYANIALGYSYLGQYDLALPVLEKALDLCIQQKDHALSLTVLAENIHTLIHLDKYDLIKTYLNAIDSTKLNTDDQLEYARMIIKLQNHLIENSNANKEYLEFQI